jgi:hypothetical protein
MPKVKLDALQEGMVVTSDVKNLDDMLLIPAGCTLTEKHIDILRAWGIPEVQVESAGESAEAADPLQLLSPEGLASLEVEVRKRFWKFDETSPVQCEMLRLVLRRQARHLLAS